MRKGFSMIEAKWMLGTEELTDAFYIRKEVFIKEQQISEAIEYDEWDPKAFHVVVYEQGQPKATGRLIKQKDQYLLGRIAVLKEARGKGLGDLVVRMLIRKAFDLGATEVHIHAQISARPFYEKLGFEAYGDCYDEAGILHISMVKKEDIQGSCAQ